MTWTKLSTSRISRTTRTFLTHLTRVTRTSSLKLPSFDVPHASVLFMPELRSLETKPLSQLRFWKEISKLLRLKSTLWIHATTTRP